MDSRDAATDDRWVYTGTRTPRGGQTRWFIFYKPLNEEAARAVAA